MQYRQGMVGICSLVPLCQRCCCGLFMYMVFYGNYAVKNLVMTKVRVKSDSQLICLQAGLLLWRNDLKLNHNLFWNLIKCFLDHKLLAVSKPESVFLAPKPNQVISVHKFKLGLDVKFKSEAKIKNCEQNKGPHWRRSRIFLLLTHEMRALIHQPP